MAENENEKNMTLVKEREVELAMKDLKQQQDLLELVHQQREI